MARAITILALATLLTACADDSSYELVDIDGGVDGWTALDELEVHGPLLACPAEVSSPVDVARFNDAIDEDQLGSFYEALRDLALRHLDSSCIEDCSGAEPRECVRASCDTVAGDAIELSSVRETRAADEPAGGDVVEIAESIEVVPADDADWSRLWLMRRGLLSEGTDDERELWEIEVRWQGRLLPGWPSDGSLHGEIREWTEGDDWGAVVEWTTDRCRVVVGAGDVLLERSGAETRVATGGHRVETRPFEGDPDRLDGWLDGRCMGEIDPSTWEVVGPCLGAAAPVRPWRTPTGRSDWDDDSYPIRRCSAHHCVALKDISCLRSR